MRERLCNFMWNVVCYALGVTIAALLVYEVVSVSDLIPSWLGQAAPAVVVDDAWGSFRDKDVAAFTIASHKVAKGEPISPIFHAKAYGDAYSPEIGISVHRCNADNSRIEQPIPTHPVGEAWQSRYCFEVPGTFGSRDRILITGYLIHRRWFGIIHEDIPGLSISP